MPPQFKVGQAVKCVDDTGFARPYGEKVPVAGRMYTIRDVLGQCLRLKEIVNTPQRYASGLTECSFQASRFKRGK